MTPKGQRIGILVITIVMIVGTIGTFITMVMGQENAIKEQNKQAEEYQALIEEQQKQAKQLSEKYYPIMKEYETRPAPFDEEAVGENVSFLDLKEGDGEVITKDSVYKAYYIGWNPKGKIFDSSFEGESLKAPLDVSPGSLISGWYVGVDGMKIGGVREITIPSDLAYKDQDKGPDLPPNTPLKFIILAVPATN
jgi:FKBP-type peptidyl-prolyl cis-trans isomerase FkpA